MREPPASPPAGDGISYLRKGRLVRLELGLRPRALGTDRCTRRRELSGPGRAVVRSGRCRHVPQDLQVQRRSFELRKSLVLLRRIVIPMREVVNALMRRDLHVVTDDLMPYYQDIYDHVLRASEWTESLRDLVNSILETNLTIQGNRLNVITKKVTSWAAIIAVPTFITGFYGMNVPYPGFSRQAGFAASIAIMVIAGLVLYIIFKRKDWL